MGCTSLMKIFSFSVVVFAVLFAYLVLREDKKYPGIDPIVKIVHGIEHFLFYLCGAYHGTDRFNRYLWDITQIKVGSGSGGITGADGIVSIDLEIPSAWGRDKDTGYSVPIRLYIPEKLQETGNIEKLPVLVYMHGGGFVLISKDDLLYDIMARNFVTEGNLIVLSVEYRLAPENKFPAALMDSYSALHWIFNQEHEYSRFFDNSKVIVAGDSAGSMIAMGVSLLARDRDDLKGEIAAQVLMYPGTYYNKPTESFKKFGEDAYMLPQGKLTAQWFHDQYFDYTTNHFQLTDEDDSDKNIDLLKPSPLETIGGYPVVTQPYLNPWASESLANLPFTHMIAAEYDPLRDENILLVEKLKEYGVETKLTVAPKTAHGFFVIPLLRETTETRAIIVDTLNYLFNRV